MVLPVEHIDSLGLSSSGRNKRSDTSKVAVFVLNHGVPSNASFCVAEVMGTGAGTGTSVRVRDVWAQADAGTIAAGRSWASARPLGVHESALLVLEAI